MTHEQNQSLLTSAAAGADPPPAAPPPNLLREAENELFRKADREETDPERFSDEMGRIERETPVSDGEIEEENQFMLKRHQGFRRAAELIAASLSQVSFVQKVVLFGSVAAPLTKEVPRFRRLRRARAAIWHECKDVDLAVWVSDLGQLRQVKKAIGSALNAHQAEANQHHWPGVPHHQVDVFLFEPGTHRYRGNLCHYGACPKGKPECAVAGCGAQPFLQLFDDFKFDRFAPFGEHSVVLFERAASVPVESSPNVDEVPF